MLKNFDPELYKLIQKEHHRQVNSIELIASENYTSDHVLECLGTCPNRKYAEGEIGARYYGGCEYIDEIELLCKKRALKAFHLNSEEWGVNVHCHSGSVANLIAYNAILEPHDRIMAMSLPSGSHLSHCHSSDNKKISISSKIYECLHYTLNNEGYIDYDQLESNALLYRPKLIICGYSAYSRDLDYQRFKKIADHVGAYLMCDMSHFNGFVAAKLLNNPFDYCDIVTSTTHKLLRGPRSSMIFSRKELNKQIDFSAFPSVLGGSTYDIITALTCQLKEVDTEEYREYIKQVHKNIKIFAEKIMEYGYHIMTDGTDNHLVLINVKKTGLTGSKVEKLCEYVNISLNKNSIYGDASAFNPSGIRIGSPWMTTRGCKEEEFVKIAEFIHRSIQIGVKIQEESGKMLKDFVKRFDGDQNLEDLRKDVQEFMDKLNK